MHTYAARALHPSVGFLAGWAIALDYVMIPVVNFMIAGIFGSSLVPARAGVGVDDRPGSSSSPR